MDTADRQTQKLVELRFAADRIRKAKEAEVSKTTTVTSRPDETPSGKQPKSRFLRLAL